MLIQAIFFSVIFIFFYFFKDKKQVKMIQNFQTRLSFKQKILFFFALNVLFLLISLKTKAKINIKTSTLHKVFDFFYFHAFNNFKVSAFEHEILKNKYYYNESEEEQERFIKTTFNPLKRDPRDYRVVSKRCYQYNRYGELEYEDIPEIFETTSDLRAYAYPNYTIDELILLDKLLTVEIENLQEDAFRPINDKMTINGFLTEQGQQKDKVYYSLEFKKVPENATKMDQAQNYLDKKRILHILRFEVQKELRIQYLIQTGNLVGFIQN